MPCQEPSLSIFRRFFLVFLPNRTDFPQKNQKFPLEKYRQRVYTISCCCASYKRGSINGDVAQLGEHQVRNLGVEGSIPFVSTIWIEAGRNAAGHKEKAPHESLRISCGAFFVCILLRRCDDAAGILPLIRVRCAHPPSPQGGRLGATVKQKEKAEILPQGKAGPDKDNAKMNCKRYSPKRGGRLELPWGSYRAKATGSGCPSRAASAKVSPS